MNKFNSMLAVALLAITFTSCKKDEEPIIVVPPSDGSMLILNGLTGKETGATPGASAGNSVYVDFSKDKQTPVARKSWDLGFASGSDFSVILNNSVSAGIKVTAATSLAAIGEADTLGLTLSVSQMAPAASDFNYFDAIGGSLSGTAIPQVSATDNKVIILNRGTGGGILAKSWIKLKVTRNTNGGYTLQYGKIKETTNFTTVEIAKDAKFNFKFVSLDNGAIVSAEPEKADWDLVWGYSVYQTNFGGGLVPYNFSDLVFINSLGGTQAGEVLTSTVNYNAFVEVNIANVNFSSARNAIGDKWRSTQPATGVRTDRFYIIKDSNGNIYKLKFVSMGVGGDGGERGKPVIEYKLVKKG